MKKLCIKITLGEGETPTEVLSFKTEMIFISKGVSFKPYPCIM